MLNNIFKYIPINYLYGRIFAIFWLTIFVIVFIIILLPQKYISTSRDVLKPLSQKEVEFGNKIALNLSKFYFKDKHLPPNIDETDTDLLRQLRKEFLIKNNLVKEIRNLFLVNQKTGRILINKNNLRIGIFSSLAINPNHPQKRQYHQNLVMGPFAIPNSRYNLYITKKLEPRSPLYYKIMSTPFQILFITMLVSTPMLLWFSWLITKPARKLQRAAEKVLKGEFKEDLSLELGPKEFVKTGITFNQMVHSINQMISSNQRLLSDISHELRSPLTRLKMANALAKRKTGNSSELQRIEVESQRLENMINDLLHLSKLKLESHQNKGVVDLFELYDDILNDAKYESKNMNKLLTFNQMPKVLLKVNIPLIQSALENVIRNAIKYANKNINILFLKKRNFIDIIISDDGPGVPEAQLDEIIKPFYRVSTSRDRDSGGTGLGLAITHEAVLSHKGKLKTFINHKGGLSIVLSLPVYNIT